MRPRRYLIELIAPNGARLDAIDRELLRRLQVDAHIQNQTLARDMGLSPSGCLQRVRRLEDGGVIRRYVAVVDESVFASWSVLWIKLKLRGRARNQRTDFESRLLETPEIMEAHEVAGRFDYLLKTALPSLAAWNALRVQMDPEGRFIKSVDILAGVRTAKSDGAHPLLAPGESR